MLLDRARQLILEHQNPSVSFLQRHMRLNYNVAVTVMTKLEGDIVSSPDDLGWRRMLKTGALSKDDPRFSNF